MGNTMDEKEIRQQFKKLVITALHPECKTYEEALDKEHKIENANIIIEVNKKWLYVAPITIGRVMAVIPRLSIDNTGFFMECNEKGDLWTYRDLNCNWQLTKEGIELTDDSQSIETITELLNLFTKTSLNP